MCKRVLNIEMSNNRNIHKVLLEEAYLCRLLK
jgi:hypothetical protein